MCKSISQKGIEKALQALNAKQGNKPVSGQSLCQLNDKLISVIEWNGERLYGPQQWGLIPPWFSQGIEPLFWARIETVDNKPAFAEAFRNRRCVIPVTGFCEQGHWFGNKEPMFLAGIWNAKTGNECNCRMAFLTREAVEPVSQIHRRSPILIEERHIEQWLGASAFPPQLLLSPLSTTLLSSL